MIGTNEVRVTGIKEPAIANTKEQIDKYYTTTTEKIWWDQMQ
ncbi:MAG: hypothetical protein RMY28_021970 [Nostoc sp. ChiSLP01]|nr:hypothetical protein [Nostoc sp. CmiSLP01]MDZ8284440.1 hypothetical protein [Nostoc sp. ChiSLP01]